MATKPKPAKSKRAAPKLPPVTDAMREFAALLASELETWPNVSTKPMFGFSAFYRGTRIFAALPKTRALLKGDGFMFKLPSASEAARKEMQSDARIIPTDFANSKWFAMEVLSEKDVRDALRWLNRAYEAAR